MSTKTCGQCTVRGFSSVVTLCEDHATAAGRTAALWEAWTSKRAYWDVPHWNLIVARESVDAVDALLTAKPEWAAEWRALTALRESVSRYFRASPESDAEPRAWLDMKAAHEALAAIERSRQRKHDEAAYDPSEAFNPFAESIATDHEAQDAIADAATEQEGEPEGQREMEEWRALNALYERVGKAEWASHDAVWCSNHRVYHPPWLCEIVAAVEQTRR